MHRKWIFNKQRILLLLFCAAMLSQQGCMSFRTHFHLSSMRFDYNSLRAPAFFIVKRDHLPYKADQVSLFHWQYGVTPGKDVRYERPDLWGGNQPYEVPITTVMNVSATEGTIQPGVEYKPTVISNGSMTVVPEIELNSNGKRPRLDVEFIPPSPGVPTTSGAPLRPVTPPIPPRSKQVTPPIP